MDILRAIITGMPDFAYQNSHLFIGYRLDLRTLLPATWALLGEAKSKSEHVGKALLSPEASSELMQVYLAKGFLATTAIEGNTLSEEEVREALKGTLSLPPSRQYLEQEIRNIINAYNLVQQELDADPELPLTRERLQRYNGLILEGLEVEEGVVPGELREHSVVVGRYRAAPAADCEYLLDRLCEWLNSDDFAPSDDATALAAPLAIIKAIVAHLYLAWIHPFGDGNGRTARLLELQILLQAGFPPATSQLLSNFYNLTRTNYYRELDAASRTGSPNEFIAYAARGFTDQLREQLDVIWQQQFSDRWEQYVYQQFGGQRSETDWRRVRLVLALSRRSWELEGPVHRRDLRMLTPQLAEMYANRTDKTLSRDLNAVAELGLVRRKGSAWIPATEKIQGLQQGTRGVLAA